MASGNVTALFDVALEMLRECGLTRSQAQQALLPLLTSAVKNLEKLDPAAALTGTFARGDLETVKRHLDALKNNRPALELYRLLGLRSLDVRTRTRSCGGETDQEIDRIKPMQPTPTASYSLTLRVRLSSRAGSLGELTMAIGRAGGDIGAIDIVTVGNNYIIRDITVSSASSAHGEQIVQTVKDIDGVELLQVSDPTFLMHLGGKIEVVSKAPLKTRADLSMAYTPGVARICDAIQRSGKRLYADDQEKHGGRRD